MADAARLDRHRQTERAAVPPGFVHGDADQCMVLQRRFTRRMTRPPRLPPKFFAALISRLCSIALWDEPAFDGRSLRTANLSSWNEPAPARAQIESTSTPAHLHPQGALGLDRRFRKHAAFVSMMVLHHGAKVV